MKYWYRITMDDFWELDSSIVECVSQKLDKSEILLQTTSTINNPLQQFNTSLDFINYANSNDFWLLDEINLDTIFYSPECDDPILRGEITMGG